VVKDYYAGIVAADENVGRLFQALTGMGQLDDTAIMFSADHGFFLGEWRKYDKRFMHEPSIRTPMLIRYPRMARAGSHGKSQMVTNLDIAPTFLELAGVQVPQRMQGLSMVPFLKGETPKTWRQDWLYEYYEYPGPHNVRKNRGVRTDRYKFVHYYEAPEEFEMYDLQRIRASCTTSTATRATPRWPASCAGASTSSARRPATTTSSSRPAGGSVVSKTNSTGRKKAGAKALIINSFLRHG
jgi:arylsulfatase A-like enzyme